MEGIDGAAEVNRRIAEMDARAAGLRRMPYLGDGHTAEGVNLVEEYSRITAVWVAKAQFYGMLLAEQFDSERLRAYQAAESKDSDGKPSGRDEEGYLAGSPATRGLIGLTGEAIPYGRGEDADVAFVPTGEERRALVDLEREALREAARLIEQATKMGIALDQTEALRTYAGAITATLETVVAELGLDMRWEPVFRSARRAGLVARRSLGQDDGNPDHIGPQLSAEERIEVLELALANARREADVEASGAVIEGDVGGVRQLDQ